MCIGYSGIVLLYEVTCKLWCWLSVLPASRSNKIIMLYYLQLKRICRGVYTELHYATIIPTLFTYFLLPCHPYIFIHF